MPLAGPTAGSVAASACPADAAGYSAVPAGLAMDRTASFDADGHFAWLDLEPDARLDATLTHPRLPGIRVQGDFAVEMMPVWANCNTLSIEPYLRREVQPTTTTSWSLRYTFGG